MRKLAVVLTLVSAAAYADTEVSFGTPIVRGAYDAKAIETASASTKAAVAACADKAKLAAAATVQVTLAIGADAKLTTSGTGSKSADLDTCVAAAFATLAFDKPKDGKPVQAVVPVTLAPKKVEPPQSSSGTPSPKVGPEGLPGSGIGGLGPPGSGYGVSAGGRRVTTVPLVTIGQPKVKGELDKAIIRRYIKRNIQKLRYCYEKELLTKPKLEGTIKVTFVIDAEGTVSSSAAAGLKNTEVESCYGRVVQGIQFPKPKSGEVSVVYPFTLKPR